MSLIQTAGSKPVQQTYANTPVQSGLGLGSVPTDYGYSNAPPGVAGVPGTPGYGTPSGGGMQSYSNANPGDPGSGGATVNGVPLNQVLQMLGGGGQSSSGSYNTPGAMSGTAAGGYTQTYDPSGGMGYGNGYTYSALGGGNQNPSQLQAISDQYAAQQGANASMYGANQAANASEYGANQGANASMFGSTAAADASMHNADQGLAGVQDTNQAGITTTGMNNQTQQLLGQLGLAGQLGTAGMNLQGVQTTANDQLQAQLAGIQNQVPLANAQNAPAMLTAQTHSDLLHQLFSGGGGILGQLSGLGGGAQGAGGMGVGLNSVGGGSGPGGLDTSGANAPPVPGFQQVNAQNLMQNLNAGQAGIDQQMATLGNNLTNGRAGAGVNTTSGAGGLPPELQQQMAQSSMQQSNANDLNWANYANTANNQNNLAYGQMGLGQYNANQNRLLQLLGLEGQSEGQLIGALS